MIPGIQGIHPILGDDASHIFSWSAATLPSLTSDSNAWTDFTFRQYIPAATIPSNGNYVRFSFRSGSAEGLIVSQCTIGIGVGLSANFAGTPLAVTFNGGSPGFSIAANTTQMSDPINLPLTTSDSIMIAAYTPTGSTANDTYRSHATGGLPNAQTYYKTGNDVTTVSTSGYTVAGNIVRLEDLEVSL